MRRLPTVKQKAFCPFHVWNEHFLAKSGLLLVATTLAAAALVAV